MYRTVAALYVDPAGVYASLPAVDMWDELRDARRYEGPYPVVAHPPCERWGRLWHTKAGAVKGDDGGTFAAALVAVRRYGGVLEHPAVSGAWDAFGLNRPPMDGGWVAADWLHGYEGWTCCVFQGAYGHFAPKATWLYAHGVPALPELRWGVHDPGGRCQDAKPRNLRWRTPQPFAQLLVDLARSAS